MASPDLTPKRPDPDALLALARADRPGRLKIFLGAAPGVGKTYAMLAAAQRLKAEGHPPVVGLVETHGRKETVALTEGLEILPRRPVAYRGQFLEEFDLDAALARRPALLIVDELAHTNADGSRHPKRWQDVQELLDAGIDVWTALNIQHLESLADVVAQITGVQVRETVPDAILQTAQDVVLVDIPPDELIARLKAGKIYLPQTAARATENFFNRGNLTALRELALRRTADRVEDQMTQILRQKAIEGPWGASERLMVCVGPDGSGEKLVRLAARQAASLNASWIAVSLARPGAPHGPDSLDLAESLGAEVQRLTSTDFAADLLRLARRENVTQILLGQRGRALSRALLALTEDIPVMVVPLGSLPRRLDLSALTAPGLVLDLGLAALVTGLGVAVGTGLDALMELPNLSMVFLLGVLAASALRGARSASLAAGLSFLAYNFFFIEPVHTLTIAKPHELFALLIFLAVALLTGSLTARIRAQVQTAVAQTRAIEAQAGFSRKLAVASTEEDVLWAAVTQVHALMGSTAILLVPEGPDLIARAAWPPDELTDPAERTAARWALEKAEAAGWRTGTLPNIRFRFEPLRTPGRVVGVLGFEPRDPSEPLSPEDETQLSATIEQAALALDRALLVREAVKAAALEENEKIRDALLTSLSHDLRTPLAAILGSVTTLQARGGLAAGQALDLLQTIGQEAGRLNRFVGNLMEMSRIDQGALKMRRDWVDVGDAVRDAVERCGKTHPGRVTRISLAPDLRFIRGDQDLLAQVIFNLADNAHKYADEGEVAIHARNEGDQVVISVTDEGPGIKPVDLERVFEKFYRGGGTDRRKAGTGLGLSICRGLVQAMGGTIEAQSPAIRRRGTRMVVRLPAAELPEEA
ncbi:two-component system, OmpR family, sensor histidine kinase KdpD [Gemmobacter aquatilis]|uniref:histidine kinase n=1 Tax=Gemmobacter aquatilis TaxID=933059 RepID=A0A1H8MNB7_9RHOB|nr:sensor histidine kinase KdpD [Gemmobacter aquatilis]SEO18780.1 two-component system, OmpR family, sensor histidine kinase KdpD [Gemmobacter aquatilis]